MYTDLQKCTVLDTLTQLAYMTDRTKLLLIFFSITNNLHSNKMKEQTNDVVQILRNQKLFVRKMKCWQRALHVASISETENINVWACLTCSLLRSTVSVVLFPPGFAAFQNCFWAEYLFMGHSLNRQSERKDKMARTLNMQKTSECFFTCLC